MSDNSSDTLRGSDATDLYFETVFQMHAALANRNYDEAARLVRENLAYIPGWVEESVNNQGAFDISSIPSLEQGGTVFALLSDEEGIECMRDLVYSIPHLARWAIKIREHQQDMELFKAIENAVVQNPDCLQSDIAGIICEEDSRNVANLISYLEKSGRIVRRRDGREHRLLPA